MRTVFLMPELVGVRAGQIAKSCGHDFSGNIVSSLEELVSACAQHCDLLLSFGTGVIVPESIVRSPGILALNVHAGSPDFPGRDPHHFAAYYGATRYGATMHYMTTKVDQGPIVDVELADVPNGAAPADLLEMANEAGFVLLKRFFASYLAGHAPTPRNDVSWGTRTFKRSDFVELCRVDCGMNEAEFLRRAESTAMPGFNNLYMDVHGIRFRIERKLR